MAYVPPNRTPVLNLARDNEPSDDNEPSPTSLMVLPPEVRLMVYERSLDNLGTIPSVHVQPDITLTSNLLRNEALPVFYRRSTFAATVGVWNINGNQELPTSIGDSTEEMLDNVPKEHLSRITKVKLLINFNIVPSRRFEVSFDFRQWHDYARAVRVERIMPRSSVQYEDLFMSGVEEAMEMMFADVRPEDGKRVSCERVLSVVETTVDEVFWPKDEWLEMAYIETCDALGFL